ncbi:MAG: adenylate/guanylate cyclase domain-containing protein, partial [Bacteroidota bacterium]|nr:adenylate/guanylate cyclase domain-containing protein [Bacteroidota bacterium]
MNPPSGIVTFLFTDIEGSTKLSQEFPDTLQTALDKHHFILQNAVETNNGFVFKITGDAFCCAFENASDAVKAAVDVNVNLGREKWNDAVISVRTGIHSGEAEWDGDNYKGYIAMARSQRVMSAANGGQIIISNDAYKNYSVKNSPVMESSGIPSANDISFRDLGERKLKDLIQPIKLFQILSTKLPTDFPPLK